MIYHYVDNEPIISLDIQSKRGVWIEFFAYIDSGAGYSVFHSDDAEALGLKLENGRKIFLTIGDGAQIPAYIHKVPVKFADEKFVGEIAFSPSLGVGTNLLGLASFFDIFSICFHHAKKRIEINRY